MITEEWRKIPGYSPMYEVSSWGQVRSNGTVAKGRTLKARIHKFTGFPQVHLYKSGQRSWRYVHLLVAAAFPEEES
ncbi:NUMOD4 domain-containing protein [Streptomyces turgidiscabies]|uniref:NUMOD4 domain-containing protein n=1 Tax=Streptomyces turgidiscabies TaxID=85558 RepID=UPI0038F63075